MASLSYYQSLLSDQNIKAFLLALRKFEGTGGPDGYRTMFTGKLFTSYSDHPNIKNTGGRYTSTAAGAYQFVYATWQSYKKKLGLPDFSPQSQDLAAMADLDDKLALKDITEGNIKSALRKVRREWASTPFSPDNQNPATYDEWVNYYKAKGGRINEESEPNNQKTEPQQSGVSISEESSKLDKLQPVLSSSPDTLVVFDPTIQLNEIKIFDKGSYDASEYTPQKAGHNTPIVKINDMLYQYSDIDNMTLLYDNIIPRIELRLKDMSGMFVSKSNIPKDGDLINIYIKSHTPDIKPIRQDFRIIKCNKVATFGDSSGDSGLYSITGVLDVDFAYNDNEYYPNMSSTEALMDISKTMKLGFATNDKKLSDKMTWRKPMKDRLWMINNIISQSYKDDDSFYFGAIDQWYYFNFIELNKKAKSKSLDATTVSFLAGDFTYPESEEDVKSRLFQTEILLTNSPKAQGTPFFVSSFKPYNHTGDFWNEYGYMQELMYYRKDERLDTQYQMDTLIGDLEEGEIALRGRQDEDHTKNIRFRNLSLQINSNVHKNYNHAYIQNRFNLSHLRKMGLKVRTNLPNLHIHRFDTIPVFIFNTNNPIKRFSESQRELIENPKDTEAQQPAHRLDEVLSGFYLVVDIAYDYSPGENGITTSYTLAKREWTFG